MERRIVITGATSGIGREVARIYAAEGWTVGAVGRRAELLQSLKDEFAEGRVVTAVADVTSEESVSAVTGLVERMGGMDVFLHCSGIGFQNHSLDADTEIRTVGTNCEGFVRMLTFAFNYFKRKQLAGSDARGQIAVISSIAGTKGLGPAPAYSATKRFQNTYVEALSQMAVTQGLRIDFTDIRPGFVDTELLRNARYPMLMKVDPVARSVVKAIKQCKHTVTIDWRYRVLVCMWRLIPRWLWVRLFRLFAHNV